MNTFSPTKGAVRFNDPVSIAQAELVASGNYKSYFYGSTPDMTVSMVFVGKAEDSVSNAINAVRESNVPVSGGYEFPSVRPKGYPLHLKEDLTPGNPTSSHPTQGIPAQGIPVSKVQAGNAAPEKEVKNEDYETPKKRKRAKKYKTP
jgi:hypothetical protein